MGDLGEIGLIARIRDRIAGHGIDSDVVVGPGDDAAAFKVSPGELAVLTTDTLAENTHFKRATTPAHALGYKAMVANVSDVAAMAATPKAALISIALPAETPVDWVDSLYDGALEAADRYRLSVVGGDTAAAPFVIVSIVVFGQVEPTRLRLRRSAQVGDAILVTGRLGAAAAGLEILENPGLAKKVSQRETLVAAQRQPEARVVEARLIAKAGAHALEDISDGLAAEVFHIAEESQVGAKISLKDIPVADGVREVASLSGSSDLDLTLYGGEDYELVFTAEPRLAAKIKAQVEAETGTAVSLVGRIVERSAGLTVVDGKGKRTQLAGRGYEHFS